MADDPMVKDGKLVDWELAEESAPDGIKPLDMLAEHSPAMRPGSGCVEVPVLISFRLNEMTPEQRNALQRAEVALREAGIGFDTGIGIGVRDWEWDWSLRGPVGVFLKPRRDTSAKERSG